MDKCIPTKDEEKIILDSSYRGSPVFLQLGHATIMIIDSKENISYSGTPWQV